MNIPNHSRSPTKWFRLIMNIPNRSRDLAWSRGDTDCARSDMTGGTCCFSADCLTVFHANFDLGPSLSGFVGKKSIRSEIFVLECSCLVFRPGSVRKKLFLFTSFFYIFIPPWVAACGKLLLLGHNKDKRFYKTTQASCFYGHVIFFGYLYVFRWNVHLFLLLFTVFVNSRRHVCRRGCEAFQTCRSTFMSWD